MIREEKHFVTDYLIAGVILSSLAMLLLSFYVDIQVATYCLFLNLILAIGAFIMLIPSKHEYLGWAAALIVVAVLHYLVFWGTIKIVDTLIFVSIICFATVVAIRPLCSMNCNILYWGAAICTVYLIFNVHEPEYYSVQLWLRYVYMNPNTAATVSLNLLVCIIIGAVRYRKKGMWVLSAALIGCLLYILYLTHSRASFFAALLLIVLVVKNLFKPMKMGVVKWLIWMPLIAVPVVVLVFQEIFHADMTLLDKTVFSGREHKWADALQVLWSNLLRVENEFTSGLNVALRLPYMCGVVGAILYFSFYQHLAIDLSRKTMPEKRVNPAVLALGILLAQQSFESTIISGTYCIAYLGMCTLGMTIWTGADKS